MQRPVGSCAHRHRRPGRTCRSSDGTVWAWRGSKPSLNGCHSPPIRAAELHDSAPTLGRGRRRTRHFRVPAFLSVFCDDTKVRGQRRQCARSAAAGVSRELRADGSPRTHALVQSINGHVLGTGTAVVSVPPTDVCASNSRGSCPSVVGLRVGVQRACAHVLEKLLCCLFTEALCSTRVGFPRQAGLRVSRASDRSARSAAPGERIGPAGSGLSLTESPLPSPLPLLRSINSQTVRSGAPEPWL